MRQCARVHRATQQCLPPYFLGLQKGHRTPIRGSPDFVWLRLNKQSGQPRSQSLQTHPEALTD